MSKRQLVIMWIFVALLVATWLFPPWVHYGPKGFGYTITFPNRFAFLFDTWQGEYYSKLLIYRIDYARLLLLDAIILALAAGLIISLRKSS